MKALKHRNDFVIGIDGGYNNGIALYDPLKNELRLTTLNFWDTIKLLTFHYNLCKENNYKFIVVIEDVTQNKPVFAKLFPPKGAKMNRMFFIGKIAQDIGKNKQITQLLMDFCELYGITHYRIVPRSGKPKLNSQEVEKLTGIKISNQHTRDAIMLLYRNGYITYD